MSTPEQRVRDNLTGIVSVLVTGTWLAALFLDFNWWLPFMLFGYIVLVPVTALLFGDEEDVAEWWDEDEANTERERDTESDPLAELRSRYARGELTDEQFERKLERLLETESIEDVEDKTGRTREREHELE